MGHKRNFVRLLKRDGLETLRRLEAEDKAEAARLKRTLNPWQKILRCIRGEHLRNYELINDLKVQLKAAGVLALTKKEEKEVYRQKLAATKELAKALKEGRAEVAVKPGSKSPSISPSIQQPANGKKPM